MTRRAAPEAVERIVVLDGVYRDSIMLMAASKSLEERDGIIEAAVLAATALNLNLLEDGGYSIPDGQLNPDSLVIAIRASTDTAAAAALDEVERLLYGTRSASDAPDQPLARSFRSVVRQTPGVNVALVSAPGAHAMREVSAALDAGLHCFCFSSGIDVRDEAALKAKAAERGQLLMGPDCGTSIIDGVGLGFANVVRRGPLGLIGA
ncbi:MAG: FdrA family protein, partial [Dehalococcoidia bacterium]